MHRRHFVASLMAATGSLAITRTAIAQVTPAGAMPTSVYLAMAAKGSDFLETTARDAFAKTGNPRVKRFARAEVVEQVNLTTKLQPWMAPLMAAPGMAPGGVVGGLVAAPVVIAGGVVAGTAGLVGGVLGVPSAPGMSSDAQKRETIAGLAAMPGSPRYDGMFVNASLMGHQEAQQIHGSYAQSGEDPALRRIAAGTLPLIRLHISQLSQMQAMMGPTS